MAGFLHVLENSQNQHLACKTATYLLKLRTGELVAPTNPLSTIRKGCTDN